ncbi:hypothetical protein GMOD_00006958 [Pyrenophora seminiperda CCB06]|uniref:Uncharacterized protein n=1 Tax=Pyrenophora seminiperda CCB06 TaxID=1302712 RepID=A0A3M7MC85_9PLEO|nr:hypothetical protein GMOD_00006958 [Pyrenophora seminiperda CCB06]
MKHTPGASRLSIAPSTFTPKDPYPLRIVILVDICNLDALDSEPTWDRACPPPPPGATAELIHRLKRL